MARRAGIRHFVFVGHRWGNELEGMGADEGARYALAFDLRHVAGDALAPRTVFLVVRMLFQTGSMRPVRGTWTMAIQAEFIRRLP